VCADSFSFPFAWITGVRDIARELGNGFWWEEEGVWGTGFEVY